MEVVTEPSYLAWYDSGLGEALISIVPPHGIVAPTSSLKPASLGKVPGCLGALGWQGYDWRSAKHTREEVEQWEADGANLGLRTALYPAIDIDVYDASMADAIEGIVRKKLGAFAPCRTGRAPKRLLLYCTQTPSAKRKLAWVDGHGVRHAVEILGAGEQAVIAGIHPGTGKPYTWTEPSPVLGAWLLTEVTPTQLDDLMIAIGEFVKEQGHSPAQQSTGTTERTNVDQNALAGDFEMVAAAVRATPNTSDSHPLREDYIRQGAAIKGALPNNPEGAEELFAEWALLWPDNTVESIKADWHGLKPPYAIGAGWIYQKASKYGFDAHIVSQFVAEEAPRQETILPATRGTRTGIRVLTVAELLKEPDLEWQVEGMVPSRSIGMIYGASGSGKTFCALELCLCIASGLPFLGHPVKQGRVVYVAAEGQLKERVAAWIATHPEVSLDNFVVVPYAPNLATLPEATCLASAIEQAVGSAVDLLVLDTWARVTPESDENSRQDMGMAFDICARIAWKFDSGLLIVHHTGAQSGASHRPRGSSVLFAALDYGWLVEDKDDDHTISCAKMRDGGPFPTHAFRLARSADSCVVEAGAIEATKARQSGTRLSPSQVEALAVLKGEGVPMRSTEWWDATGLARRTFQNARTALMKKGLVAMEGARYVVIGSASECHSVPNGTLGVGEMVPTVPPPSRGGADGIAAEGGLS